VFTSKTGNTFLNIGATYPNQTFTGWIPPASPVNKSPENFTLNSMTIGDVAAALSIQLQTNLSLPPPAPASGFTFIDRTLGTRSL
jgi:hypothetical protein